ncbi:gliding motility lipoprotein GldD [Croceivirga thetidis]|uniref:Gliding motility lipoprotein GldD n=1 Tax=Croceivirga thetidis TaxID=2721623 RepID=A0ABX1GNM2_9FLAO|nr:gliding motility lipoprotein GldD [Croceivirga thetidis]NKI31523.1 gliding motility lipoprotein GldD [Croceivirga thetidis]
MRVRLSVGFLVLLVICGCQENLLPKPKAMLKLEFPEGIYDEFEESCNYTFEKNFLANSKTGRDCSLILDYPSMKGSIYITYKPVEENLEKLLIDAQKLSYEHVAKADNIIEQPFINENDSVFGMFYEVTGNAASQSQFYVTDSTNHFVTGSLYFYAKPNYDSIYPAAIYLQKDIRRIMETLNWK